MQIFDEWAGYYFDPTENSDKIWSAAWTDTGDYLAIWGRRGNRRYQSQIKKLGSPAAARLEFFKMVRQKEAKGYRKIPFENTSYGNIPSFQRLQSPSREPGTGKITGSRLLEQIRALAERVKTRFEPDTMLVEFNQLKAVTGLVVEYAGRLKVKIGVDSSETEIDLPPGALEAGLEDLTRTIKQALLA